MAMLRGVTGSLRKGESERSHGTILLTCRAVLGGRRAGYAATARSRPSAHASLARIVRSARSRGRSIPREAERRKRPPLLACALSRARAVPPRGVGRSSDHWPRSRSRLPQGCVASSRWARVGVEPLSGGDCWAAGPASTDPTPQSRRARFAPAAHSSSGGRPDVSRSRTSRSRTRSVRGHVFAGSVQLAKHVRAGGPLHHGDGWGQTGPGDSP